MGSKEILRKILLNKRRNLDIKDVVLVSKKITNLIKKDPNFIKSKKIGIYISINNEIDLSFLLDEDKEFYLPKTINNNLVEFIKIDANTKYRKTKLKTIEPINGTKTTKLDYLILPSIAISKEKYRIGYGKGYYDRYLKEYRAKYVVGVIYTFQEVEKFKYTNYDQKLDYYFKG